MNWYKIRVDFVIETAHSCDCEYCVYSGTNKDDYSDVTLVAKNEDEAREEAIEQVKGDWSGITKITAKILETKEAPEGKFLLDSYRQVNMSNGMICDGFVALYPDYCISYSEKKIAQEVGSMFDLLPLHKLEGYRVENDYYQDIAVYEEGAFNLDWVKRLNEIGIAVHAVDGGDKNKPFALCKDGKLVGAIMPKHYGR